MADIPRGALSRTERLASLPISAAGRATLGLGQRLVGRSQIEELPVVRTVVIEVVRYQAECANCHQRTTAEPPPWFAPQATFGPRIEACAGPTLPLLA